ncbi:MAG: hypothetical protein DLM68_05360, partial [Hyphomicrobiales bacterium]
MFDDAVIGFLCPQCAHETKKTITWIKANDTLSCEGCGDVIPFERDFLRGIHEDDKSIDHLKGISKNT